MHIVLEDNTNHMQQRSLTDVSLSTSKGKARADDLAQH